MEIPKKPLAVSRAKKKLPVEIDWGPGIPKDRLRYINAKEEALVKRFRKTKAARDYAGIPAYPDPGDTAAGEKGKTGTTTGKTTGSGSTSGGIDQGGQNKGPGGAGQGPNSSSSTSKTASSASSSASKTSSSPSSTAAGGSKSPNAAAQAASDKLNGKTSPTSTPKTNAAASVSPSKAPNAAAAAASQKLNASQGLQKASSQPKSIQGMINSQISNPVSLSASLDGGYYHNGFSRNPRSAGFDKLPGMENPNQFDKTVYSSGMVTAAHVPYDKFVKNYDPNKLTPGAQKIHQAIVDNAFRTNQPVEFFSGARPFNPRSPTKNHPSRQAIDIRMMDPVTGRPVGFGEIGAFSYNPIGSYNPDAGRSYSVAEKVQDALAGPYRGFATGVLNSFMDNPGVYGDFNNQRWGGSFGVDSWKTDRSALDYMHFDEGKVMSAVSADQADLRKEAANHTPRRGGTQLAGTPFSNETTLTATAPPNAPKLGASGLQAALDSWNPPSYSKIPEPDSVGYPGLGNTTVAADPRNNVPKGSYPAAKPESAFAQDPRLSVPQGAYPAAKPPSAFAQDPRLNTPQGSLPAASPTSTLAQDPRLSLPQGAYPARAQSMVAGDPRVVQTPLGSYPQARQPSQVSTDPRVSQTPPGAFPAAQRPASVFAQDPRVSMRPGSYPAGPEERVLSVENYIDPTGIRDPQAATMSAPQPQSPLPASIPGFSPPGLPGNFRGTAGQAYTYSSPSTFSADNYNPEAAPGDAVPEDDPTYSASPVQGSDNPMQEDFPVEEPAVKQERQKKYASRGATIGSVIAGPLGALIGGTLGWQMGKTTPGQRRSIANSPQALNANAQSINQLVEERGGKNDPNMRVRPEGLKVVLTNPKLVLDQPEAFTDLEQMLAALAAGIDPETGKPIS